MTLLDKREQSVGDGSFAIQAKGDVHFGNSTSEIITICELFLRNEMANLREDARNTAKIRVDEFAGQIVEKFSTDLDSLLVEKLKDPDIQYSLNNSVIQVARKGIGVKSDLLKELIVSKIKSEDEDQDLILDQALEITSKLSTNEIKFLSFVYYLHHCKKTINGHVIDVVLVNKQDDNFPMNITKEMVQSLYKSIYNNYDIDFNRFMGEATSLRGVDISMLQIKGCLYPGKIYIQSVIDVIEEKTGLSVKQSINRQEILPVIHEILEKFSIKDLDELCTITLSQIGNIIAENYLHAKKFL